MLIRYELIAADVAAYAAYYVQHIATAQIARIQWRYSALVAAVGVGAWVATGEVSWFFGFLVGAVVCAWYIRSSALRSATASSLRDRWECFGREHIMEITDEGVWSKCEASDSLTRWPAIRDVVSTPDHIFVIVQGGGGFPIPRARTIDGDIELFLQALRNARAAN